MKKFLLLLIIVGLSKIGYAQKMNALDNIRDKIRWDTPADSLLQRIEELEQLDAKTRNAYVRYWKAYACYLLAGIYYAKKADDSEQLIKKGIDILEKIDNKNADHYALLSLLQGFGLSFTNKLLIPIKAKAVEKNAQKAIDLQADNSRAYLAMGMYDSNVPKAFGGRQVCESMFKKALTLPEGNDPNPYAPDWGHRNAYNRLIDYYVKEEKPEQAIPYVKEAYAKYPSSPYLKKMYAQLVKN